MGGVEVWRMDGVKGVQLPNFRSPQPAVLVSPHHLNAETFGTTLPRKQEVPSVLPQDPSVFLPQLSSFKGVPQAPIRREQHTFSRTTPEAGRVTAKLGDYNYTT
jgi:hypothetical protein